MSWRFLNTGLRRGTFNMQYDEYLAKRLLEGSGEPTLRVYGWQPHAISIGFHQDEGGIDHGRCRGDGIDVVRRPTGGRAILHAHEVTYSVVMLSEGRSVMDVYAHISRALVLSLKHLGVTADVSPMSRPDTHRSDAGVACFAAASRCEVQVDGKKIVGSAQHRYEGAENGCVVLQHGSVLLGVQHRRLGEYVRHSGRRRDAVRSALEERTMEVESILRRPVAFEEAAEAVRRGFEEAWGPMFVPPAEKRLQGYVDGGSEELFTITSEYGTP